MVLQRWQTVYLLISVIAMALAAAFPAVEPLRVAQPVVELGGAVLVARVLAAAIAVFLLVTITKFKNLKMQQMLCSVGVLLMLAEIAVVARVCSLSFCSKVGMFFSFLYLISLLFSISDCKSNH